MADSTNNSYSNWQTEVTTETLGPNYQQLQGHLQKSIEAIYQQLNISEYWWYGEPNCPCQYSKTDFESHSLFCTAYKKSL